jgi:hypothetical protein
MTHVNQLKLHEPRDFQTWVNSPIFPGHRQKNECSRRQSVSKENTNIAIRRFIDWIIDCRLHRLHWVNKWLIYFIEWVIGFIKWLIYFIEWVIGFIDWMNDWFTLLIEWLIDLLQWLDDFSYRLNGWLIYFIVQWLKDLLQWLDNLPHLLIGWLIYFIDWLLYWLSDWLHWLGKDLPKMIMFCDWLSETKMIIVRDSLFRKTISIVLLSCIVIINQPRAWMV